ncbi:MAG: hypothetical protein ABMA25_06315 [Ilumatobacteraceae bacterium]
MNTFGGARLATWQHRGVRFLVHAFVAVLTTAPLGWRLSDGLPLGREPVATVPMFNLWSLRWTGMCLPTEVGRWWDAPIFWPTDGAYARSELQPITGLAHGLLRAVVGDAAAYGLLVILSLTLVGLAAAAVARRVGVSPVPAAAAGVLAQTIPFLFEQLGVLQLLMLWPVLFAIDSLLAWVQTPRLAHAARIGGWVAVAYLTCGYHAALFVMAFGLSAPLLVQRSWRGEWRRRLGGVALAAAVAAVLAGPFALGQANRLGDRRWTDATIRAGSATWRAWWPGGSPWPGVIVVVLAVAGIVIGRRQRAVWWLTALGLAGLLLALGSNLSLFGWRPYSFLVDHVGVVARLRSPFRATALAQLVMALLAALTLQWAWQRRPRVWLGRSAAAAVLAVVLLTADLGSGEIRALPPTDLVWMEWLAEHPGGSVLMLPMAPGSGVEDFEATAAAMLQGLVHGHPLVNGYTGFFPAGHRQQRERLAGFPDAESVAELREMGVVYVVADSLWWNSRRDGAARDVGLTIVLAGPDGVLIDLRESGSAGNQTD